ncbi:sensor histidine kinase [Actinoallomurus sp. CA-150999]|uniref:sensor histidine kinase n=1 Tax=Actinoallomurus sp. CA-150999 TaxID=3239887 RepID=UPI003D900B1C
MLLCIGLLFADSLTGVRHPAAAEFALRTTGIVIAALTVATRRLYPRWSFAVATLCAFVVAAVGGAPQVSACVAVTAYTAARAGEYMFWWSRPGVAGLLTAAGIGIGRVSSSWLAVLVANVAIVCVGWFAGLVARERRIRLIATAEQQAERERQHAGRIRQAAIDERLVIARELHDIVAHSMSVIAVRSGVARMVIDTDPAQARETLGIIETTTRQALHEMRLLVEVLRHEHAIDPTLTPTPGLADIAALADQIHRADVDLRLDVRGPTRPLPAGVDLSAYRIAQEALTNIVRHVGPTQATLRIEYRTEDLLIEVTDTGPSEPTRRAHPEPHTATGHGLIGMRERAALYDGYLHAGRHGGGFQVQALLRTDETAP